MQITARHFSESCTSQTSDSAGNELSERATQSIHSRSGHSKCRHQHRGQQHRSSSMKCRCQGFRQSGWPTQMRPRRPQREGRFARPADHQSDLRKEVVLIATDLMFLGWMRRALLEVTAGLVRTLLVKRKQTQRLMMMSSFEQQQISPRARSELRNLSVQGTWPTRRSSSSTCMP